MTSHHKYLPLTFVPDIIVDESRKGALAVLPHHIRTQSVLLLADVSGFTKLTASYLDRGTSCVADLARDLNGYMSTLVAMLLEAGADILSFAGDAFFCQWEINEPEKPVGDVALRAFKCAVNLQTHQCLQTKNLNGALRVKLGIAIGEIDTWVLGSPNEFLLFVVAGPGLPVVHKAEHLCTAGEIVISGDVFNILNEEAYKKFSIQLVGEGYVKITNYTPNPLVGEPRPQRGLYFKESDNENIEFLSNFCIPSIKEIKTKYELRYLSELSMVTVLFISLEDVDVTKPTVLDVTFDIVFACTRKKGGCLNKMLLFDKGCTFLVVFGLPGLKHVNDPPRALLCANDIVEKHKEINLKCNIGVATGMCYCGIVGHPDRQEYTVIGSAVNMAARLMENYRDYSVSLGSATYSLSHDELGVNAFMELPMRKMKGIVSAGPIYSLKIMHPERSKVRGVASIAGLVEDIPVQQDEYEKILLKRCLASVWTDKGVQACRKAYHFPVIVIEGSGIIAQRYLLHYVLREGQRIGYRCVPICILQSHLKSPFFAVASIVSRILGLDNLKTDEEKQKEIFSVLHRDCKNLYLLNHLFGVQFPVRERIDIDEYASDKYTSELFSQIFDTCCANRPILVAIEGSAFIDKKSWLLLRNLCEKERILLALNLNLNFIEPSISASLLYMQALTRINVDYCSFKYLGSIICWNMGVQAMNRSILKYLEKESRDPLALQEMLVSLSITDSTHYIPIEEANKRKNKFYYLELDSADEEAIEVLAWDLKPGVNIEAWTAADNIYDALKDKFTYLNVREHLLVKHAAILGSDFDLQHLEAFCGEMNKSEVEDCINNLTSKFILSISCVSHHKLANTKPTPTERSLKIYKTCFCKRAAGRFVFRNPQEPILISGYSFHLRFFSNILRTFVLSYMSKEQLFDLHVNLAIELICDGGKCDQCSNVSSLTIKDIDDVESLVDANMCPISSRCMDACSCVMLQPSLFYCVASLFASVKVRLVSTFYIIKTTEALNDYKYPFEALIMINAAEKSIQSEGEQMPNVDIASAIDKLTMKASIFNVKAKSALLLGNVYQAVSYIQKALNVFGLDLIFFYGLYDQQNMKFILERMFFNQGKCMTISIAILAHALTKAKVYKYAHEVLKVLFVALRLYPISFIEVMRAHLLLYRCMSNLEPGKKHEKLERNTLTLCHHRFQTYISNVLEVKLIQNIYITIILTNLCRGRFERSIKLTRNAKKILGCFNMREEASFFDILMTEINYHCNGSDNPLEILKNFVLEDGSPFITAHYMCALSSALIWSLKDKNMFSLLIEIKRCNEYAIEWKNTSRLLEPNLVFYVSVKMAHWCVKCQEMGKYTEANRAFTECMEIAADLYPSQKQDTYWSVGATLLFFQMYFTQLADQLEESKATIEETLKKMQKKTKSHFPIYKSELQELLKEF